MELDRSLEQRDCLEVFLPLDKVRAGGLRPRVVWVGLEPIDDGIFVERIDLSGFGLTKSASGAKPGQAGGKAVNPS
ncbi:MAG: hypothetical protein Ct9H300mP32_6120 [Verrucomicrobiota bacterium]|nr:MAG: hypothetical protein Ct9H300mP32_6120 [Verrucomicrobiota bacterium]